jgi:hypothetical protein
LLCLLTVKPPIIAGGDSVKTGGGVLRQCHEHGGNNGRAYSEKRFLPSHGHDGMTAVFVTPLVGFGNTPAAGA